MTEMVHEDWILEAHLKTGIGAALGAGTELLGIDEIVERSWDRKFASRLAW